MKEIYVKFNELQQKRKEIIKKLGKTKSEKKSQHLVLNLWKITEEIKRYEKENNIIVMFL